MPKFDATCITHTPFSFFDEVTSTNDVLALKGKEGAPHLTAIMADAQTKGRGRLGRKWVTYPECAIALSVLIRDEVPILPLLIAVALRRAFVATSGQSTSIKIKWPNDIHIFNKKVAGILIESFPHAGKRFYVVGIGVNMLKPPNGFLQEDATSLDILDKNSQINREDVVNNILSALKEMLHIFQEEGAAPIIQAYKEHCNTFGKEVLWQDGTEQIKGQAVDINTQGHLLLKTEVGVYTCRVGDLIK